jgi:methyl-accepting chemotaxis protein
MEAIVVAAREQDAGLGQVNTAMTQMDKLTQGNAAAAEQSASASEELHAQTEELRGAMRALREIVRGANARINAPSTAREPQLALPNGGSKSLKKKETGAGA